MLSSDFKPILLHASHQQNSVWAKLCVPRAFPALLVSLSQFLSGASTPEMQNYDTGTHPES